MLASWYGNTVKISDYPEPEYKTIILFGNHRTLNQQSTRTICLFIIDVYTASSNPWPNNSHYANNQSGKIGVSYQP